MEQYSYLLFGLILLIPWIAAHLARPDLRRELWISSLATSPLGPFFEYWYHRDYWNPEVLGPWSVGFEDILYGFCVGGLGAVSYEIIFNRTREPRYGQRNPIFFFLAFLFGALAHVVIIPAGVNSIYVSAAVFVLVTLVMLLARPDLLPVAVTSGLALALIMIASYQIVLLFHETLFADFWRLENLSGVFILRVPLEEFLWGFGWGAFIGCAWKFGYGEICVPRRPAMDNTPERAK